MVLGHACCHKSRIGDNFSLFFIVPGFPSVTQEICSGICGSWRSSKAAGNTQALHGCYWCFSVPLLPCLQPRCYGKGKNSNLMIHQIYLMLKRLNRTINFLVSFDLLRVSMLFWVSWRYYRCFCCVFLLLRFACCPTPSCQMWLVTRCGCWNVHTHLAAATPQCSSPSPFLSEPSWSCLTSRTGSDALLIW